MSGEVGSADQVVRERIRGGGPLTFAEFMGIALYDPVVGYYAQRRLPLGASGDYYTSAELHPAFAALIGVQVEQLWRWLDCPTPFVLHEAGPGSGRFARDLLDWAREASSTLYRSLEYRLDERSPALRREQQRLLNEAGHGQVVSWVDGFEADSPVNFILANELLDALPVHLVQRGAGGLEELFVALDGDRLALRVGPLSSPSIEECRGALEPILPEGFRTEVNLAAVDWMRRAAASIQRGLLLVVDYGYERTAGPGGGQAGSEPRPYGRTAGGPGGRGLQTEGAYETRSSRWAGRAGSVLCYYRHTLNSEPLARVGQQDITSHVDFHSVRRAGEQAGLSSVGLLRQRELLGNLGLPGLHRAIERAGLGQSEWEANLRALATLVAPDGLGRVLALLQHRGLDGLAPVALTGDRERGWEYLPLRKPDHLLLPGLAEGEGLADFESQWAEFWSEQDSGC